jgi:23S rRNA (cytidine1920-2'-O)/16S rRNA (cytidine1409-2'-O)-methyltransferase
MRPLPPQLSRMAKLEKQRVDILLVEQGLAESREKAQALIMAGLVYAKDQKLTKAGHRIDAATDLTVKGKDHPYVSRGGVKLAGAFDHFAELDATGVVAIDVGASTGGFTDVLLRHGASKVYAVDVGHGQLDWSLRNDDRVVVLERTNARHLNEDHIPDPIDLVVCDASFISLTKVLPASLALVKSGGMLAALIKPQFEVGKGQVGKGGVVRDPDLHQAVQDDIAGWLTDEMGWQVIGITESSIKGPEGNREFIIVARKP